MVSCNKMENIHFSQIFLNIDISLIIALTCLKTSIHSAEISLEGSMSQNFD